MQQDVVLIKLGGSVVTHKERPMTINKIAIDRIFKSLLSIKVPIILVHGGGSFGHYWSIKYDMHSKPDRYPSDGIAVVHESMISLNHIMVKSMIHEPLLYHRTDAYRVWNAYHTLLTNSVQKTPRHEQV